MAASPTNPAADLPEAFTVDSAELRAQVSARTPIRFTTTNEPYIPLPAPLERFYLGAARQSDVPHDVAMMSDVRVARTLVGPPFPMPLANTLRSLARERAAVTALFAAYAEGTFRPAAAAPFCILRERQGDGSDAYVGQITMFYCGDEEKRQTPVNDAWEEWRTRTKVWEIGAALRPEYHGKGLASAAVNIMLNEWAVPQMGCTEIRAQCFMSNLGSVKLWEKHGFVEEPALRGVFLSRLSSSEIRIRKIFTSFRHKLTHSLSRCSSRERGQGRWG
ncbi:acyl-CoA N-acyltransferase [Mycena capillaripes]|nr:acyl-CoA N-acyltransferase [Mycena capillaripes]